MIIKNEKWKLTMKNFKLTIKNENLECKMKKLHLPKGLLSSNDKTDIISESDVITVSCGSFKSSTISIPLKFATACFLFGPISVFLFLFFRL